MLNYDLSTESVNWRSPVLGCLRCATGRSSDAHQGPWWSWPLWLTGQSSLELLWVCETSMSVWSVSTSPCRSVNWTGSQTQTQRSRHLCPCWWRTFHWSPLRWIHQNLNWNERWFRTGSPQTLCSCICSKSSACLLHTNSNARVTVDSLHQLLALMPDHPVGVNLGGARGVQRNHLESAEVCFTDGKVLWTHIIDVQNVILVKIVFAYVATAIACKKNHKIKPRSYQINRHTLCIWNRKRATDVSRDAILRGWLTIRVNLIRVISQPTIVFVIRNAVVVIIMVAGIPLAIFVVVCLVGIGYVGAIVQVVLVTVLINVLVVVTLVSYAIWVWVNLEENRIPLWWDFLWDWFSHYKTLVLTSKNSLHPLPTSLNMRGATQDMN